MEKCHFPEGIIIRPDGVNELDPCEYETVQVYANVIVEVMKCRRCGHTEIAWRRTNDTIEIPEEDWEGLIE